MYEIRLNEAILHDSDVYSERRLSAGKITEEVNQIPSFSFKIPVMNPLFSAEFHDRKDIISIKNTLTNKIEFEGVLMSHEQSMDSGGNLSISAFAEGFLGYLCDSIQLYRHYENYCPADFLSALLENHNAQVSPEKRLYLGRCEILKSDYSASKTTAYRTTLEEIKVNLIERIGGEIRVRKDEGRLYLDYLEQIGTESVTAIELAENMKSLDVKTDSTNIITRLIPLGTQLDDETARRLTIEEVNENKPYIDDFQAIERFGIIVGTVEFDDISTPENLLEKGRKYLENNNRILKSYEAKILDLSVLYESHHSIECGNIYTFRNEIFGLDEPLRIIKKTTDIYKPYSPVVQIGDKSESITDIAVKQAKMIDYKLPEQRINILNSAKENASNLIKSGFNGYVVANENEICIMDTPDKSTAQKVWRWNENGLGFSENGYNGTFGTAITNDGKIVADFITAGILRGIEIRNGDDTFRVSPDGTVTASAMNITGGSIHITTDSAKHDIISLIHGGDGTYIAPEQLRIWSGNGSGILLQGSMIAGYSNISLENEENGFSIYSDTGDFFTNGDIRAKELYYLSDDGYFSVRTNFDILIQSLTASNQNIISTNGALDNLASHVDDLGSYVDNQLASVWEQMQTLADAINSISRGE